MNPNQRVVDQFNRAKLYVITCPPKEGPVGYEPMVRAACEGGADVVQLRDKASVTGTILAEKRDQVVVDVGYTVLTVPRSQIVRITRDEELEAQAKAVKAKETPKPSKQSAGAVPKKNEPAAPERQGLYSVSVTPPPERSVRELVNLLTKRVG